jgi:hypothetical protein
MISTSKRHTRDLTSCSNRYRNGHSNGSSRPWTRRFVRPFSFVSISILLGALAATSILANLYLLSWLPLSISPEWVESEGLSSEMTEEDNFEQEEQVVVNPEVLHIVTTRFMQNQAQLLALGNSRLRLFETFCFPSMKSQQVSNFLWFIMTDPNLDPTLMEPLKNLLAPHPNFYLIPYNDHLMSPDDFAAIATTEDCMVSGDINLLLSSLYDTNRSVLLETRLDADDALHSNALLDIQDAALSLPDDSEGWQVVCNSIHYEWRNPEITSFSQVVRTPGSLRVVQESICVTPGYTLIKHRSNHSVSMPAPPRTPHHLITRDWPRCGEKKTNATTNCWIKMKRYPSALRCRTITSAGMSRIETTPEELSIYDNQTEIFWNFVERDYGILPEAALNASQYLQENLKSVVYDNLMGQW